jgi:hypothetical protein
LINYNYLASLVCYKSLALNMLLFYRREVAFKLCSRKGDVMMLFIGVIILWFLAVIMLMALFGSAKGEDKMRSKSVNFSKLTSGS